MDNLRPEPQTALPLTFVEVKPEINILIVEDSESDRFSYKRYLQSNPEQQYHIIEAETLEEGLELWRSQHPNVVLLDMNLPDGNGLEFLEAIGTEKLANKLPVIMLTGAGDERIAVRAMKLGATDYLVKGDVTAVSLLTCINQVQENNLLLRQLKRSQQQQAILGSMALHVRRSVAFEDVSNAIVQEICSFLGADRTIIYRFNPDMSGAFVAEAVVPPWLPSLNMQIEDTCFRENLGGEYRKGKIFVAHDIYNANLTECHIHLLERFQVRANLVVPILLNGTNALWGLLIVHQCSAPRQWLEEDIQLLHQLTIHLAIALQQAELYQNLQTMNSLLEERVQERTKKLQLQSQVLEEIHDGVVTTDLNGTILSWNLGAEKLYGYTEAEILGRNVSFMYEDAEALGAEVLAPLLDKGSHTAEVVVLSKSGKRIYLSLRLSVVKDDQGNITHLIGCANDISDRKQAELELRKSESRFRQLFESAVVGTLAANFQGQITDANDLFLDMLGYTRQELESGLIRWDEITPPEYVADDFKAMSHLLEYGTISPWEKQYYRKDGSRISVLLGAVLLSDSEDQTICIAVDISDRKQAEDQLYRLNQELEAKVLERTQELAQVNSLQHAILESANYGIISTDLDGIIQTCNPSVERMLGYSASELIGITPEIMHDRQEVIDRAVALSAELGQDIPVGFEAFVAKSRQGVVSEREWTYIRKDGSRFPALLSVTALKDDNQQIIGFLGIAQDITERKQAEEALRESEQRFVNLSEAAPVGIFQADATRQIIYANTAWGHITGREPEAALGGGWLDTIHPEDRERILRESREGISQRSSFQTEARCLKPDGTIAWFYCQISPKLDSNHNVLGYIGTLTDISDRKQAEAELQNLSNRLGLALRSGAIGCWEWDLVNNIKVWDARMYEIYGLSGQDINSITYEIWANILHPDDLLPTTNLLQQAILGEAEYDTEFRIIHPDGSIHFAKAYGVVVRDTHGNPQSMIGINFDISDRKQSEEALRESEELKRRILESSSDCIKLLDLDGRLLYINEGGLCILEIDDFSLFHNANWIALWPEASHSDIEAAVSIAKSGQTGSFQGFCPTAKGNPKWWDVVVTPIRDGNGQVVQLLSVSRDITDRKRAEQEILENQRFIQQIADSSPNVLYLYDIQEQRNTYANREIWAALGYTATEIQEMGTSWLPTVIHPDDLLPTSEHIERLKLAEDGEVLSNEYRFRHVNGEWRYFYSRDLIFSRDPQGQVKLIIGTAQDITDRKQAETALRASDQRWQFALESAGDGIWDWNIQTNEVFFSPQWKSLLGYTEDEIENRFESWENLVHPDDLAQCYEDINKCLNSETILYENEHRLLCKDGSYKWILSRGKVFEWDDNGNALRMMGMHTDLSDRKRIALEFQQLSERLTLALRSGAIGCWDWDKTDNSLYWDDRMYEIYRVTKTSDARLTYDTWVNAVHPEDRSVTETLIQQAALGITEFNTEFRIVRPDGEIDFIKAYGVGIPDIYGNIQNMIGINFDISDRKQAEAQLQQINDELLRATKLKDEFLANMSHELRTPLNAILGMSEALLEQILGSINERQQKAIGNIERSGRHLLELINDILDLSKIASGKMELNRTSTSITNLCSSSEVFVRQQAFQKNIQIISNIPPNLRDMTVDERRIKQVLINLLTNAVKFTPNDGQINFSVAIGHGNTWLGEVQIPNQVRSGDSPMILFQVTDTGIGIADKDLSRLFQPFVQVDSNLNRQYEGTGLGLAMVKQIVELHGGQVTVESQLGQGSCFTVALPYEMTDPSSLKTSTESTNAPVMASSDNAIAPLILLAEDNEANIDNFRMYLTAVNYRLIVAKNGEEAIALAKSEKPDIILMDIQMPIMDGLEATRLIRADAEIADIPIIALTALAVEGDRERCLEAGANEYISKPVRLRQLAIKIAELLSSL